MPIHKATVAAAIRKYGALEDEGLLQALKIDEKKWSEEEIDELYEAITANQASEKAQADARQLAIDIAKAGNPGQPAGEAKPPSVNGGKLTVEKKLYDKWRGSWMPYEKMNNPATGKDIVITWRFERSGMSPNKTDIRLTEDQAKLFNSGKQLRSMNTPTEQLFPAGQTADIFDRLANPFLVTKV